LKNVANQTVAGPHWLP